ncbi:MAG: hypothetical protein HOP15_08735 [Planctomycetes bacterium]|nr:hypothetical protein [Planctomycetota bacterium]
MSPGSAMHLSRIPFFLAPLALTPASSMSAQQVADFHAIPMPAGATSATAKAISPDGSYVVGQLTFSGDQRAYRWSATTGVTTVLPHAAGGIDFSEAGGVSIPQTGGTTVGVRRPFLPCAWNSAGAAFDQPLPGGVTGGRIEDLSSANFLSVGYGLVGSIPYPLQWALSFPSGTSVTYLDTLPGVAHAISAFGNLAVGERRIGGVAHAVRWGLGTGSASLLDDATSPFESSVALRTSTDGSISVGYGIDGSFPVAAQWRDGQTSALTDPTGALLPLVASAVSGLGQRIVGTALKSSSTAAFVWDADDGVRELQQVLAQDHGVTLPGWHLLFAEDISGDGRCIAGWGVNPAGVKQAFRVVLPGPCPADLSGDGYVSMADVGPFSVAYNSGGAQADLNGDGLVNLVDIAIFSAALQGDCD